MILSGAKILMECLLEQGVKTVFGFPGAAVIDIYDELLRYGKKINHILVSHEQHAAHAADGYARTTGKVGVCIATSGPGATNLITGIAAAYMDSSPVVFITGNVGTPLIGKDSFQEVDITSVSMPITKNNYMVKDVGILAATIREAFSLAMSGRPGPVLIDIPKNVQTEKTEFSSPSVNTLPDAYNRRLYSDLYFEDIDVLADMIKDSERPLLLAGGGVIRSSASSELIEFAELIDAPVALTMMGLGAFPANDPHYIGLMGMHGSKASTVATDECDLLIAIGTRFSDRLTVDESNFAKNAKIVHIDIDRAEINKNVNSDHHITGDAKTVISTILDKLSTENSSFHHVEWMKRIQTLIERPIQSSSVGGAANSAAGNAATAAAGGADSAAGNVLGGAISPAAGDAATAAAGNAVGGDLHPAAIMAVIQELTRDDTIIVTDVGQHQIWTAQYYRFQRPNLFLSSGGFGVMGFGAGAAVGACFGAMDHGVGGKPVILITGDGSFRMNSMELATMEYYGLPIIVIILNNRSLGMVRQWQSMFYKKRYSSTTLERGPDFVKLAEAFLIKGVRADSISEFRSMLREMLAVSKPGLIELRISRDLQVTPMSNHSF